MEAEQTGTALAPVAPEAIAPPVAKGAAALVAVGERGIMLKSLEDLLRFGRLAVEAGAAPKGMTSAGAAMAIQAGLERGLGPLGGLQSALVINGLLSWRGQAAMALIQNSPVCKPGTLRAWTEGRGEQMVGIAVAHRVGYAEGDRREFTVQDAKTAGLWGKSGPWSQYPGRQLMWRALGFLARDVFPDVLGGFPIAEEAQDFEERPAPTTATERAAMLPPPKPDPLMAAISDAPKPVDAIPVAATSSPADEPGAAESARLFNTAPRDCAHPSMTPARAAALRNGGETPVCDDCGEVLPGEEE